MIKFIRKFVNDEAGASAAEYALILAIVGAGIAVASFALGGAITDSMESATNCIKAGSETAAADCFKPNT